MQALNRFGREWRCDLRLWAGLELNDACQDAITAVKSSQRSFGGDWTSEKLERVRKYLVAYATIMNKQNFRFAYIDAFAGTGYRTLKHDEKPLSRIFPEVFESVPNSFSMARPELPFKLNPASLSTSSLSAIWIE